MKKIALLTLLLINLSLSFSLPRNQASPAIFSVTKTNNSILFRHTDSTLTAIPCQSVASIVSNADPSKIVSVWVVQQGDYDKIMQFDYSVCGFSSKSDAVDSLTAWAICDTSSGGGGGVGSPAGSDTQIQYNNAGAFGADSKFYRNLTSNQTGIFNTYDLGGSVFTTTGFCNLNSASLMFSKLDADPTSNVIFRSDANELKATVSSSASGNTNALQVSQTNIIVGNISGGNNTKITIDDVTQLVTISNVPTYADDAAAAIGGLTSGMLYKTTTGGITALNIVP